MPKGVGGNLHRMHRRAPLRARIAALTNRTATCWLWTGSGRGNGYAGLKVGTRWFQVHRLVWEMERGAIPAGMCVLHNCPDGDNPLCINPDHLWLGTRAQNNADRDAKGRTVQARGFAIRGMLTDSDVLSIRKQHKAGVSQASLALQFNVTSQNIRAIVRRRTWAHLAPTETPAPETTETA